MRTLALALAALLLASAMAGCSSPSDAQASVYVKDAPADEWQSIFVTFNEVSVHQSGGNGSSGWHVLFEDSEGVTVDLLNASGVRAAFLGETGLPAGHYQQVRINATEAYGIRMDGTRVDIDLPDKTPLRAVKSFKVEEGKETQIVIDIDLEKSLVQKGSGWEFKGKIGKVYTHVKEKDGKPAEGEIAPVDLTDDPA